MNGIAHFGHEPSAMMFSPRQWLARARSIAVAESKFAIFGFMRALEVKCKVWHVAVIVTPRSARPVLPTAPGRSRYATDSWRTSAEGQHGSLHHVSAPMLTAPDNDRTM